MVNPDAKGTSVDSFIVSLPIAIFFLLIMITIFQFKDSISYFKMVLWLGLPIMVFGVATIVNLTNQYVSCQTTNTGKAILGAIPSVIAMLIGLYISSISYCRIPVATVFSPLFINQSVDVVASKLNSNVNSLKNSNLKEYNTQRATLENIENKYPIVAGISHGFYVMFAILYGMTIGNGIATIC
jgi:hypothetical protein